MSKGGPVRLAPPSVTSMPPARPVEELTTRSPGGPGSVPPPSIDSEATVWELLTVYVPVMPKPVPRAVTTVPDAMAVAAPGAAVIVVPTPMTGNPVVGDVTVSVVPDMLAVKPV